MDQIHLPLWPRVIFVDWSGVLSNDVFWASIRTNNKHPLHSPLAAVSHDFFGENSSKFASWMRGEIGVEDVVEDFGISSKDRRFPDLTAFLVKRAHDDCNRMRVREQLLKTICAIHEYCFVVLATDNTDIFQNTVLELRSRSLKSETEDACLENVVRTFDDVLCSSSLGVLKKEAPEVFFGSWLANRGLAFSDAILLDDSKINCEAFERFGGRAIEIPKNLTEETISALKHELDLWLWSK